MSGVQENWSRRGLRSPRTHVAPPRLYAIADADTLGVEALPRAVSSMVEEGVSWIQIRAKSLEDRDLYRLVEDCCRRLVGTSASLWLDDRADIAALLPIFGVHLGQRDLPAPAAREIVGGEVAISVSTHSLEQLAAADKDQAVDVIALGPIFETSSKTDPEPVVGLETLRRARSLTDKPLVAIGGIEVSNLTAVLEAGAECAALLGAVCRGDVAMNCRRLRVAAEEAR